jgi:predicted PurR-regulated permease PerM
MARSDPSAKIPHFAVLGSICIVIAALYFAQEFLVPIALAVLISFLLAPLVRRLERLRFPRAVAVLSTVILAFALLGVIGFIVYNQMVDLNRQLPTFENNIKTKVTELRSSGGFLAGVRQMVEKSHQVLGTPGPTTAPSGWRWALPVVVTNGGVPAPVNETVSTPFQLIESVGGKLLGPVGTAFIVIVFTIFILFQREDLRDRLMRLAGRGRLTATTEALDDAAARVSRYLLMQSIINGSIGAVVALSLWSIGKLNGQPFPSPALWGLLAAVLRFIPYVGIWIAAAVPLLLSLAAYSTARVALEALAAYIAIELIAGNVFEPLLFGASTGIATLAILVAAAFWTWLWGPIGLLLSTPMTVCVVVLGKHVPQLEFLNILLGDEPALEPSARIYQRLLSLDQEEADEMVNDYAAKMPIEQLYDEVLAPTLALAEVDRHQGKLDEDHHAAILHGLRDIVDELGDRHRAEQVRLAAEKTVEQAKSERPLDQSNGQPNAGATAFAQPPADTRAAIPQGCLVNIVTLPAHDQADDIAAIMLTQLLEIRGYCASAVSVEQLAGEMLATVEKAKADVVCVSALPPAAVTHARYLCKRLHGKLPDLDVVVGLWTVPGDLKRSKDRIACVHSVRMASSFRQAMDEIRQLVQPKLMLLQDKDNERKSATDR